MAQNETLMKGDILNCVTDMKKWVNYKNMSDITFLIGPDKKVFYAHRMMLAARSEVFRAMFAELGQNKIKDGTSPFVLSDTSPEIFMAVLEYIYTNCVTLNSKIAIDVMGTATEYGLDGLRLLCNDYLKMKLSVNTACDTMQAAVTFGQNELQEATLAYIEANTQGVFKADSFHELSDTALALVLRSSKLQIDERDILTHVREWTAVNSVVMEHKKCDVVKNVIGHVRLALLSSEELEDVENENATDKLIPDDMIAFAWKCHALKAVKKDNPLTTKRNGTVARDSHKWLQAA